MPGLIPDINFQPYVQPNQDLPIRDIQEYQKEQRDKYAQALSLKNTAADALHNNKNVLDIDRLQYTADANAIHENLGTLGGSVGNYEDNVGKAQHLARQAQAEMEHYAERYKDVNENYKKIDENKEYGVEDRSDFKGYVDVINSGKKGKAVVFEPVKNKGINEAVDKIGAAAKEQTIEGGQVIIPLKDSSGNVVETIRQSVTTKGWNPGNLRKITENYLRNDIERNAVNEQQAEVKAVNNKTIKWLSDNGVPSDDIKNAFEKYFSQHPELDPHDPNNRYLAQKQVGLDLIRKKDILDAEDQVVRNHPISRTTQDSNIPEGSAGGFGSKSEKVRSINAGADINTNANDKTAIENFNFNTNENDVHTGGFAVKTGKLQRSSGLDYYDENKNLVHVRSANIDFDYVKNRPFAKNKVTTIDKNGNEIDVPKGTPLRVGDINRLVEKFKEKNKGATKDQIQNYVNENVGTKLMIDALIFDPSNPNATTSGYIPLKNEDIDDIIVQNNIKSKKEQNIIADEVKKQGNPYIITEAKENRSPSPSVDPNKKQIQGF